MSTYHGWQPIETAPKDALIILYRPTAPADWQKVSIGKWDSQCYHKKPQPFWDSWLKIGSVAESRAHPPTLWMPMPEPPVTKT